MKKFAFIFFLIGLISVQAQDLSDQNPNYEQSRNKYMATAENYTQHQGTTVQDTYKAIDELEAKRERKELRKKMRAMRPYWRHQRRMERIKNRRFYRNRYYDRGFYRPYPYRRYNYHNHCN